MMTEMVETLDRGAVYLDVFSLEEGVAFNLFSAAGVIDAGIWPGHRRERIALIERWRSTSLQAARATFSGKAAPTWLLSDLAALDTQLDDQFFNYLRSRLDPVETPTRFIVFPHRELFQLPFWRLTTSRPDLPVSVLPGVNVAPLLARRDRTSPGPLVACGDATSQLAHVETELQRLPPHTVCDPSPAAILGAWPQARTIHFAGHGHFDTDNPYKSGLIAAGVPDSSDPLVASHDALPGCQLLTIGWILGRLRLDHCQLAVLSACYTGLPRTHPASEFTSLPAALIVAGARNVVASLWPAHDGATRLLMTEFYAALESESPSQALARARRRLGTMTRDEIVTQLGSDRGLPPGERPFESPFYTDAFQHYGVD